MFSQYDEKIGCPTIFTRKVIYKARKMSQGKAIKSSLAFTKTLGLKCSKPSALKLMNKISKKYSKPKVKPDLSKKAQKKRNDFAEIHLRDDELWKRTIFTDEKIFKLDGPDDTRMCWRDDSESNGFCFQSTNPKASVMIWAGIGYNFKTPIHFVTGTMNAKKYIETIEQSLLPFIPHNWNRKWRLL